MIEDNEMDTQELDAASDPNFNEMLQDLGAVDNAESGEGESQGDEGDVVDDIDSEAAVGMVAVGLMMSENYIARASGLPFQFDETFKGEFLEASGPLMEKYGATWIGWFKQWKEEIVFGSAAFSLYLSSRSQLMKLQIEHMGDNKKDGEKTTDTATAAA